MVSYIKADKLLKALRNRQVTNVMYDIVEHEISYLDNENVAPIIHGKWGKEIGTLGWDGCSYQCNKCGRSIHLDTFFEDLDDYPYCHCGAKMVKENLK